MERFDCPRFILGRDEFAFDLLRDREKAIALAQETLPLSDSEFAKISDRFTGTIFATVAGTAAVSTLQGAPGVVRGPLVVSISLTLMEIWKARNFEPVE